LNAALLLSFAETKLRTMLRLAFHCCNCPSLSTLPGTCICVHNCALSILLRIAAISVFVVCTRFVFVVFISTISLIRHCCSLTLDSRSMIRACMIAFTSLPICALILASTHTHELPEKFITSSQRTLQFWRCRCCQILLPLL
jgi:hypothetical protein